MTDKYYMTLFDEHEKEILIKIKNGETDIKIKSLPCIIKNPEEALKKRRRLWTKEEDEFLLDMKKYGIRVVVISKALLRTVASTNNRYRYLSLINNTYNEGHREDKYKSNEEFCKVLGNVDSILDAYSGVSSYWKRHLESSGAFVITNDINENINAAFHVPAKTLVKRFKKLGARFDIVDLDPFGSAYECFDDAIEICKKGLIMTFGDKIGVRSNKNLPLERYNCSKYDEEKIIRYFVSRAEKKGVNLTKVIHKHWKHTWRVYFKICS